MSLIYLYRLATFALVIIFAIAVAALGGQSISAKKGLPPATKSILAGFGLDVGQDFAYAYFAAGGGALTLISLPVILVLDFLPISGLHLPIVFELGWLGFLCLVWIAAGALTFSEANYSNLPGSCDDFKPVDQLVTLCRQSEPIGVLSFIVAGLLLLYALGLATYCFVKGRSAARVWGESVKNVEKA